MSSYNILTAEKYGYFTSFGASNSFQTNDAQTQTDQGTYINVNNGQSDESTFGQMLGPELVWGDSSDKIHLSKQAGWHKLATNAQEATTHFYGDVYQNSSGQLLMVAGDAAKNVDYVDGTTTASHSHSVLKGKQQGHGLGLDPSDNGARQADIDKDISKIEAYMKSVKGSTGVVDGTVDAGEIRAAITKGNLFTGDKKKFWTGVANKMEVEKVNGTTDIKLGANNTANAASVVGALLTCNFEAMGAQGFNDGNGNPIK